MALAEQWGYPYEISGPPVVEETHYGFHGMDTLPTGAEYLCDGVDPQTWGQGKASYLVLMDIPEPPDDLPPGWVAEPYDMHHGWRNDDGVAIVVAIHEKADCSWVFASYCR